MLVREAITRDGKRGCPGAGATKSLRNATKSSGERAARWSTRHGWAERAAAEPRKRKATGGQPPRKKREKRATTTTAASITRPDAHGIVPVLCTLAGEPLCRMARHFCYDQPIRRVIEFSFSTWLRKIGCRDTPPIPRRGIDQSRVFVPSPPLAQRLTRGSLILFSPNEHVDGAWPRVSRRTLVCILLSKLFSEWIDTVFLEGIDFYLDNSSIICDYIWRINVNGRSDRDEYSERTWTVLWSGVRNHRRQSYKYYRLQ